MKNRRVNYYSLRSQLMHALIAVMVLGLLTLGAMFPYLSDSISDRAYMLHKSFGILVLFLMILRLWFIHQDGRPALPKDTPRAEYLLLRSVQYLLYLCLLLMPICGWVMSVAKGHIPSFFNLFNLDLPFVPLDKALGHRFADYHYILAWCIVGLLVLHMLGSIKHYFIDKDHVLASMWNFRRK